MNNDSPAVMSPLAARVYGVAAFLGPLLLLAATIGFIVEGEGINHGVLGGTIGVWSAFTMIIAMMGVLRLLEVNRPRAAPILTILAVSGFAAGSAFDVEAAFRAMVPGFDDAVNASVDDGSGAIAIFMFIPWGWFAPLSLILLGIFLWRSRTSPWWTGALMIAGGVLFVVGQMERVGLLAAVSNVVLLLAFAPIGWTLLTTHARRAAAAGGARPASLAEPSPR
jgi:hypothetical protein